MREGEIDTVKEREREVRRRNERKNVKEKNSERDENV